jgi:cyclic-di-GMP phosphodiesterase TipF (flagellum assembly factor)
MNLDLQDMSRSDVRFLRVGAQFLLDEIVELDGRPVIRALPDLAAEDFSALARRYGVEVVAEKVESERHVAEVLDLDIAFGQGHLFGEPRPIRDQVLAEADPPAEFLREGLRRRYGG